MTYGRHEPIPEHVRQCPHCELRFGDEWQLEDHLRADHQVDVEKLRHVSWRAVENPGPH